MIHTERFAPSPTGKLHLGHAFSAMLAHDRARAAGGRFLVRIEDLDTGRVRGEYTQAILEDLAWLGLEWDAPPLLQSMRQAAYLDALERLNGLGLIFACTCTRRDIAEAIAAPHAEEARPAPYPGTCRGRRVGDAPDAALRLDLDKAMQHLGPGILEALAWREEASGTRFLDARSLTRDHGDIVLKRRDGAIAYHLAVVLDDAFQNVSHVTRGADLAEATGIHRLLQALLRLPSPVYNHHRLIRDSTGKRLAKRHDALALAQLRDEGWTPSRIRAELGLT